MSQKAPVLIPVSDARALAASALARAGLAPPEAGQVAEVLIEAELAGRSTHGLMRLPRLVERVRTRKRVPISVVQDGPSCALLDGGNNLGYLVAVRAVDLAAAKALDENGPGLAIVAARNTSHSGFMGYYVRRAAERTPHRPGGVIAMITADCTARIAPTGAAEALFGTNPIAVGVPRGEGVQPIIVDFSTAAITNGQLMIARDIPGFRLPPGLAFDASGRPTDDPVEALKGAVVPMAAHKGYCLALLVQVLTTALTGADPLPQSGVDYGIVVVALRPDLFVPLAEFEKAVSAIAEAAGRLKPAPAGPDQPPSGVRLPGERAARERQQRLADGIGLDQDLLVQLKNLGGDL